MSKKNKDIVIKEGVSHLYLKVAILVFFFFQFTLFITGAIIAILQTGPLHSITIINFRTFPLIFTISILIACGIFSAILSYILAKHYLHPLVDLSQKSIQVSKGDFSVTVNEESSLPELKETLHSFNIMVKELSNVETLSNDFIANVSHEFKTPLSVIRSYVNILENGDLTEDEKNNYLAAIDESVEKLSTLVSNVLRICKLDNQSIGKEETVFRLDEHLRQAILLQAEMIESKNIDLDIDIDDISIYEDENLLSQVWNNLLSNAIKFSPEGGTIRIAEHTDASRNIIVSIEDHGIGMDEETKKRIFDRFYQGDSSHTRVGNGLGLSIVQSIIRYLGLKIKVHSKVNEGSTFIVIIPSSKFRESN